MVQQFSGTLQLLLKDLKVSVEVASNGGEFTELAMVGTDVTKYDITKSDDTGWMSFKISAVYTDGQKAEGKVFGLPGQYK